MHRIDGDANFPTGHFSGGDPTIPRPPTQVTPEILDDATQEICSVIEGLRVALVKGNQTQLRDALGINLIGAAQLLKSGATQSGTHGGRFRLVVKPSGTASEVLLTLNAAWDTGGAQWTADDASSPSVAIRLSAEHTPWPMPISFLRHNGASPFADAAFLPYDSSGLDPLVNVQAPVVPALLNSWVTGARPFGFYVDPLGRCWFYGSLNGGGAASGSIVCVLPAYARPSAALTFFVENNVANGSIYLNVATNGNVTVTFGGVLGVIFLDAFSFRL